MRAPSVPRKLKAVATKVFKDGDFKVGDIVYHRSWTLQYSSHDVSYPVIDRRLRVVTDIVSISGRVYVYTGDFSFSASELIKGS